MPQVTGDSRMPGWLERPGASEAVVVGADIRSRYAALHADLQTRSDLVCLYVYTYVYYAVYMYMSMYSTFQLFFDSQTFKTNASFKIL